MRNIAKFAAAATFAGALALSAATPSYADGGRNTAAAIGFGAGALVGAAAAGAAYNGGYYGAGYGYAPGYAYEPGYSYGGYAYAPGYSYAPAPAYTYSAPAPQVTYERSYAYSPAPMAAPAQCWVSTDSSRGYGYYGSCASNNKDLDAGALGQARRNVRPVR
jgi:hypothetical protein